MLRHCGHRGDSYAAQIGVDQFRMYVDQETGILLMLDAGTTRAGACSVTVTEITVDDPPSAPPSTMT